MVNFNKIIAIFIILLLAIIIILATLREARKFAKIAEVTSDLSTYEDNKIKKKSSKQFVELPQYNDDLLNDEQSIV